MWFNLDTLYYIAIISYKYSKNNNSLYQKSRINFTIGDISFEFTLFSRFRIPKNQASACYYRPKFSIHLSNIFHLSLFFLHIDLSSTLQADIITQEKLLGYASFSLFGYYSFMGGIIH